KENSEEKNSENFEEDFEENKIQEFETLENENLNNSKNELTTKTLKTEITPRPTKTEILQNDPNYQDFLEISNGIKQLIESQKRINITNSQLSNWITEISKLYKSLESARGSENAIYSMFLIINTLNADIHYEDKYKPVIESGKSFREKFIKIEDYYKRRQMQYMKQKQEDDWDDLVL
ncbi:MAG: hypothetical protein PHY80_04385, partial [Rickettsiales bacterium]|nr:hypothetical protein [Rickettsiales bacterium]